MKEQDIRNANIIRENLSVLLEDNSAVDFCVTLFEISQLFDDIYDEGLLARKEVIDLIFKTIIHLPNNQFYSTFKNKLQPLIESYFLQWMSANSIEEFDGEKQLEKSYMLRAFIFQIYHFCGMLLKGKDFAISEAVVFQNCYGEKFEEYKKEFV